MAVLATRELGVVAAGAVATATILAATAGVGAGVGAFDVPLVAVAAGLAAGVVAASRRRSPSVLPVGRDVIVLTAVTVAGFFVLSLLRWTNQQHVADVARLLPFAVIALGALWPEPNVLRYCLLLAAGTLLGNGAGGQAPARWAIGASVASMALAMVATNRLSAASGPALGGAAPARGRRVGTEALAVLAVVGLLAALAASLVPPPPGQGGGGLGDARRRSLPQPAAPEVRFEDRLDVGAGRGGRDGAYVLQVRAEHADLWRARTYDHWDGESWSRSPQSLEVLEDDYVVPGIGDFESDVDDIGMYQVVGVLARSMSVLAAAAMPEYASVEGAAVLEAPDASLYPSPALVRGDLYIVSSRRATAGAGRLRDIGDTPAGKVPDDVADAYLQLPQVSPPVRALAAAVTAGRSTTYDKVKAVERWIDGHTTVTDDATPVADGRDPLEAFLLDDRAGPPERAATSMAVMLRTLGIPARMAVGFLPGKRSAPDEPFLVRASDTHAWVEVWFPTVGWQRFDPTGRAPDPRERDSVWDRLLRFLRRLWPLLLALVAGGAGWAAWRVLVWRRRQAALPWVTRFFARVEKAGAVRGRLRQAQETPAEYANVLAGGVLPDPRLVEVGAVVTSAAWSRHEPAVEERARAEAVLRAAVKATPARRLRRFIRRTRPQPAYGPTIAKP